MPFGNIEEVQKFIADENVQFVDVRFTDVPGREHHFSIPASMFDEEVMEEGLAFDGSSIKGFTTIEESDMTLMPDLATAKLDPVSYTHLRAHETGRNLVCRLLLEKKK